MGNFNRGGDRGGDRGGFRGRDRGPVTMHKAICSNCGQSCEVPFRPTGEKPVYCNNCFGKMRDNEGGGDRGGDRGRGEDRYPRRDFGGAPPRQSFESNKGGGNADVVRQLEMVNTKLDKLIKALEKPVIAVEPKPSFSGTLKQAVKKATDTKKKK